MRDKDIRRFWSKVALPDENGCMLWLGKPRKDGYAIFSLNRWPILAHRIAYELAYGPVPDGLQVDHVKSRGCRHRHCVAPAHLEAVTQRENIRRGNAGKHNIGKRWGRHRVGTEQ